MNVPPFDYESRQQRVIFGSGSRTRLSEILDGSGYGAPFVVIGRAAARRVDPAIDELLGRAAAVWTEVAQHVPIDVAERARRAVERAAAHAVVAIGGGSAIGLAKAIALTHSLPIVAVPTTYAGSEQTTIYGLTGDRHKQTGRSNSVLPQAVIYDPELTLDLPAAVTAASAFNALAHSVEALYAHGHNPITSAHALDSVRWISRALPQVMENRRDVGARSALQFGAFLAGRALDATSAGLHHKICHVLGGAFGLVHADAHSAVLPHVVAFNAPALPGEMAALSAAFGIEGVPAAALWDLAKASGVPTSLDELGLPRADLADLAGRVTSEVADNPRPFGIDDIVELLERAYTGTRPVETDVPCGSAADSPWRQRA